MAKYCKGNSVQLYKTEFELKSIQRLFFFLEFLESLSEK